MALPYMTSAASRRTLPWIGQIRPLSGEERGVLRQNAELRGQADDLVDQFLDLRVLHRRRRIGPRLPDGVDQLGDLAAGPQARHEPVLLAGLCEVEAGLEGPSLAEVVPRHFEDDRLVADVLAQQDEPVAFEQIGQLLGQDVPGSTDGGVAVGVGDSQFRLGENRPGQLPEDLADLGLDILLRQDEFRPARAIRRRSSPAAER